MRSSASIWSCNIKEIQIMGCFCSTPHSYRKAPPLILLHLLLRLLVSFVTLFYIFHHLFSCIKSLKFNFCSYWKWGGGSIWAVWETKQFSSWWWSYREGILSYSCYWISLLFLVWLRKVKLELLMQIISLYICTGWVLPDIIQGSWPKKPVCR